MIPPRQHAYYGWKRQLPDANDRRFAVVHHRRIGDLPSKVDLSLDKAMPPVFDQGELGSCTANAIVSAVMFQLCREGQECFMGSRLFIYYEERRIEGTIYSDAGAVIRDGFKVIADSGMPPESLWPYDISRFADAPPPTVYTEAKKHYAIEYLAVDQRIEDIKAAIASRFPVVFGFSVYPYFESDEMARAAVLHLPEPGEQVLGGHCVKIIGYDDHAVYNPLLPPGYVKIKNSWGSDWGQNGFFWMPYSYLLDPNLCSDFWTVRDLNG